MTQSSSRWILITGMLLIGLVVVAMTVWAGLAIYYSYLPEKVRPVLAVLYVIASLSIFAMIRPMRLALGAYAVLFLCVLVGWLSMKPSNDREWQPDVARMPHAEIDGDRITVRNIRNCDYRTETDYTVSYYDMTVNLSELESIDFYMVDWGLKHLVHTMVSFGFGDDRYICISIETRKEVGEDYSTIKGFFRQYELYYVLADERDVVRLRTNYRVGEDVRLYRIKGLSKELMHEIFMHYMDTINSLQSKPEWYNALTGNCTTQIRRHTYPYTHTKWDWRLILNGYLDTLFYEKGSIDTSMPLETLKQKSLINDRGKKAGNSKDYSKIIREGLPGMNDMTSRSETP